MSILKHYELSLAKNKMYALLVHFCEITIFDVQNSGIGQIIFSGPLNAWPRSGVFIGVSLLSLTPINYTRYSDIVCLQGAKTRSIQCIYALFVL